MPVHFNHTIIQSRDGAASSAFLSEILGLPPAKKWGPFWIVATDNDVSLDFVESDKEVRSRHFAFLVSEAEFDEILGRIKQRGLTFWADPSQMDEGRINTHDGGCGVYFPDPNGHLLEIITRPYGSGDA